MWDMHGPLLLIMLLLKCLKSLLLILQDKSIYLYFCYITDTHRSLDKVLKKYDNSKPGIILYNAGTDCMVNDPLGNLSISPQVCNITPASSLGSQTIVMGVVIPHY